MSRRYADPFGAAARRLQVGHCGYSKLKRVMAAYTSEVAIEVSNKLRANHYACCCGSTGFTQGVKEVIEHSVFSLNFVAAFLPLLIRVVFVCRLILFEFGLGFVN